MLQLRPKKEVVTLRPVKCVRVYRDGFFVVVTLESPGWRTVDLPGHWVSVRKGIISGRFVGFDVYCPPSLGLRGKVRITQILDAVLLASDTAFGPYIREIYELAEGLTVVAPSHDNLWR